MKNLLRDFGVKLLRLRGAEMFEPLKKQIRLRLLVLKTARSTEHGRDDAGCPFRVFEKTLEERHHFGHVRAFGLRAGAVVCLVTLPTAHATAEHHPERTRDFVRAELAPVAAEQSKLLVEHEQAAHEQLLRAILRPGGEIQYLEILPVTVAVKIAVAVIEEDGLAVVAHQQLTLPTAGRAHGLGKGRAVFHEESARAQCLLPVLPGLRVAAHAFVAFIHEHEIASA